MEIDNLPWKAPGRALSPFRLRAERGLVAGAILLGLLTAVPVRATDDPEPPKPWPARLLHGLKTAADRGYIAITSALFHGADELGVKLFDLPQDGRAKVKIQRDVYDNFDLLNTYTVIDRVQLHAEVRPFQGLATWTEDVQTFGLGTPYAGFIFEPQGMIEWVNVRPVRAFQLKQETKTDELRARARLFLAGEAPPADPTPDPDLSEVNPDFPITFRDPSLRAKFSKMTNLVTFPFRLPLARRDVGRMKDGEILGYAFDGQVEVGLGVGLKVIPSLDVLHAGIDFRGTAVLRGRYQISVLREDARFARVKVTRLGEHGWKTQLQAGIEWRNAYDGMMVFRGTKLEQENFLAADLKIIPFRWETARLGASQFDAVYRYDLESEAGRAAFHRAVLGSFGKSEEVVEASLDAAERSGTAAPVERLLTRDGDRLTKSNRVRAELSEILHLDWNRTRETLEAKLELPDGVHHLHQATRETRRETSTLFSSARENTGLRMTLVLDEALFARLDPEAIFAIAEFTEEDSSTKGKELRKAIDRMEARLRKPDLLPEVVERLPRERNPGRTRRAWHGRSSFYYGYSLAMREIGDFLRADPAVVEAAARRQFLDDDDFFEFLARWQTAARAFRDAAPARELFAKLRALFTDRVPVGALTEVIFDSLPGRSIDYFVTAQNVTFGTIQERGKTVTSVERLLTYTDRELGFETFSQRLKQDSDAVTREVDVVRDAAGWLELRFRLSHLPEHVFFRLYRTTGFRKQKRVAEIVIANVAREGKIRFVAGLNRIRLDPESLDALTAKLSRELRAGEHYSISIGYSRAASRFGPVAGERFEVTAPYPAP